MRWTSTIFAALALAIAIDRASAQSWNDDRTRALIERATARRARQLADTGLVDYHATAHGYLTFLAQVGEGFREPPKVVKADELALDVYWRAPSFSKQIIVGRRDTLLLPTDINYHRDHLGIVQNNFPSTIRLGEGDEVRDVAHPLSAIGIATYDFAISDSLRISLPGRTIDVYEVKVRPKDDRGQAIVGAIYIDPSESQVVRMAFSFTRASLLDKQLEDISVVLENALIEGRFWLPRRQEIEIRRTGTWLDYPARGIIRGRWEICCYQVNRGVNPAMFATGPEFVQLSPQQLHRYPWKGAILDSLPSEVRVARDEDVRRVQEEARSLVRAQALARTRSTALVARSISDFAAIDRVQGLSLGTGVGHRFGSGVSMTFGGRYGFDDHEPKGRAVLDWERASGAGIRALAFREYRDARDESETSRIRNSIGAQEFGADYSQLFDVRGGGLRADLGAFSGVHWTLQGTWERQSALDVNARPATGHYDPTIAARSLEGPRLTLGLSRPTSTSLFGTELHAQGELRFGTSQPLGADRSDDDALHRGFVRGFAMLHIERPSTSGRLVLETSLAALANGGATQPQEYIYLGGPITGPGYDPFAFTGRIGATQRIEWRLPISAPSIPLGRFGATAKSATLAPFAHTVYLASPESTPGATSGWFPSAGVGVLGLFDLLRFDVARGLRNGRWTFGVDVSRDFWGIL